ncbi:glycosyl transferase [Planctomycetales bacterium]|nr:glycosyl transferase [Planctomycetales bacterium]
MDNRYFQKLPLFVKIVLIVLFTLNICLLIGLNAATSLNRTETAHLGSAAYLWNTGKFDLFHVNPPLTRFTVGLPIILNAPKYDWKSYSPRPQDRSEWATGAAFIAANDANTIRWLTFLGRCTLIPFILIGSWYGFKLASEMFGYPAGLIFITLWTFSPLFLGWGATLCPDMTAAALGMPAVYYFRRWLLAHSWKTAIIAGIGIGLLPLAKITWIIAFGLFPFIWILSKNKPPLKQLCVILLTALYILNTGYLFDGSFRLLKEYTFISKTLRGDSVNRFGDSILGYIPVPLPSEFVQGIDTQRRDFERGLESYLFGKHQKHGWRYYYFIVFVLKEPLGTILLAAIAAWIVMSQKKYRGLWNDEILIFVPFFILLFVLCSQNGISVHPRYMLPILPFLYLFVARIGKAFEYKQRLIQIITVICLGWTMMSSIYSYPYSMAYFNELIPVKERPEYLLGSNIDWGQSAYFLKSWLEKHPEASQIRIEYHSPEGIERIGITAQGVPPSKPEPGWFAIDVNGLYSPDGKYAYFKQFEPIAIIGNSIFVYHLSEYNIKRAEKTGKNTL